MKYLLCFQIKVVFLYWLPCILRMSRPHRTSQYDYPPASRPSSVAADRKPLHLQDVELKDRSSKSLLANVLDIDDDFRHNHRSGGTPTSLPTATFFRTVYRYALKLNTYFLVIYQSCYQLSYRYLLSFENMVTMLLYCIQFVFF